MSVIKNPPCREADLKILQINNYGFVRGGSDRYFLDLSRLLEESGHQISYLSTANVNNLVTSGYDVDGFNVDEPSLLDISAFFYSRDARKKISALLDRIQPDLVHLHIYYGQITSSIIPVIKKRGIPIVQTLHEYKRLCPVVTMTLHDKPCEKCAGGNYWNTVINKCNRNNLARSVITALEAYTSKCLTLNSIDHFIAISDFVRDVMLRYGMNPEKITRVYNFLDTTGLTPARQRGEYFLFFGRLEHVKGVMTLLKAMKEIDYPLVIAGDGAARLEMERYIEKHGLSHVMMVGFKSDDELHDLIRNSRCVIAPSEWNEPFGLVLIEAFAHGKPVIASCIGGMAEVVDHGKTGLLVSPDNVDELVDVMRQMINNLEKVEQMGKWAFESVKHRFSPSSHYREIMAVYEKVLQQNRE